MTIVNRLLSFPSAATPLMSSKQDVYLGGSRRMAQRAPMLISVGNHTDYDFYATFSHELVLELSRARFHETAMPALYLDNEAVQIMIKDNVQIVLRKDANFYRDIFESIDPGFYYNYLWKSSPTAPSYEQIHAIFNQLFITARVWAQRDPVANTRSKHEPF